MRYIAFELTMPRNNSWNGKWTGDSKRYIRIIKVSEKAFEDKFRKYKEILKQTPFFYDFSDGWEAQIDVKEVSLEEAKKLKKISSGFCSYDWMLQSLILYGEIKPVESVLLQYF